MGVNLPLEGVAGFAFREYEQSIYAVYDLRVYYRATRVGGKVAEEQWRRVLKAMASVVYLVKLMRVI